MYFVTITRLNCALAQVIQELKAHGLWTSELAALDVWLVPYGNALGYQHYRTSGAIHIPAVSLGRLAQLIGWEKVSLRDVLRHEYGHGIAHCYPGLIRSGQFVRAFDAAHTADAPTEFVHGKFVTEYASTSPSEDFAETFMVYLKYHGRIPDRFATPAINRKWRFIQRLARHIAAGKRRF